MAHAGPGLGAGHGSAAGIGKQVQHPDRPTSIANLIHSKIPVHRLLGKQARMLEVHGLYLKGQLIVVNLPAFRQCFFLPVSAAGLRSEISGVCLFPCGMAMIRFPDGLRVRAHQILLVPAFQLFSSAAVQQLIILPLIRNPHQDSSLAFPGLRQNALTHNKTILL